MPQVAADIDTLLTAANAAAARTALGLTALATVVPGTGVATALAANIGAAGAPVLFNGALGTPSAGTLTNCTIPVGQITGAGTGVLTALAVNVGAAGAFVTFNGDLGTPSSGTLTSCTFPSSLVTLTGVQELSNKTLASPTLTGTTTADTVNADSGTMGQVFISRTLGTDDTWHGFAISNINAGATIAQWEAVYYDFTAGEWLLADANGSSTYPSQGLAVAASTDGNALSVMTHGIVRNDAWNWSAGPIYLSATAGGLTQTAPSTAGDKVQVVGFAVTADVAYFNFNTTFLTVA